jgi:CheY-like chemotaxis protein
MGRPIQILHVEDQAEDVHLCCHCLSEAALPVQARRVETRPEFQEALEKDNFDLILSDFTLPAFDGLSALDIARRLRPEIPFLFYSGTLGEEAAVDALKHGACDYVLKSRPLRLASAVRRALQEADERRERQQAEQALRASERLAHRHLMELEAVYRQAPVGLALLSPALRFLNLNNRFAEIAGRDLRDFLGRSLREMLPELAGKLEPICFKVIQWGRAVENIEISGAVFKSASMPRTWLSSFSPFKDALGRMQALNTSLVEITRPNCPIG